MRHGWRGGKQRKQELALLAMVIATKEENVHRGIEELPAVPSETSGVQSTHSDGERVPLEMRKLLQTIGPKRI